MAMTDGLSLADIAAVTDKNNGGMGNNGDWLAMIFLFALIFGFGGWGGNRNQPATATDAVTQSQLCSAMNFNGLENAVGRLEGQATQNYMNLQSGLSSIGYDQLREMNGIQSQIANAEAAVQSCCCATQRAIDGVNYNGAMNTAQIVQAISASDQKILDAITGNRIADMQNQINALQLQNAMCGVVRYPTAFTYSSGANPFCGCGMSGNI